MWGVKDRDQGRKGKRREWATSSVIEGRQSERFEQQKKDEQLVRANWEENIFVGTFS